MEYEREHGNSAVLSVSARAVPRILGKAGTQVLKIKEETGITELDVQRGSETSEVTIRGTTRAIAAARKLIAQIVAEVEDDLTLEFDIDPSYHQLLIGKGGAKRECSAVYRLACEIRADDYSASPRNCPTGR